MDSTPNPEHLFQFELAPVENIKPWGDNDGGGLSLSLYALTDGHFRISVGKEALLRYTPEIISRWGLCNEDAEYQVACFARDVLDSVSAVTSPIPTFFENIVRDEALFRQLRKSPAQHSHEKVPASVFAELEVEKTNGDFKQDHYNAFRWLGERSIWFNYLTSCPDVWFVRVGNEVWIQWDNVDKKFEGIDVWTARRGTYSIPVQSFLAECHSLSERLLSAMKSRIVSIENGSVHTRIPLDAASLRNQLLAFRNEFEKALSAKYHPDIDWQESEKAMRDIAFKSSITLPPV
jgi:hypothetical protein